jgi:hypothetical protein
VREEEREVQEEEEEREREAPNSRPHTLVQKYKY